MSPDDIATKKDVSELKLMILELKSFLNDHINNHGVTAMGTRQAMIFLSRNGRAYSNINSFRQAAANGLIPYRSVAGRYVFDKDVLVEWMNAGGPKREDAPELWSRIVDGNY